MKNIRIILIVSIIILVTLIFVLINYSNKIKMKSLDKNMQTEELLLDKKIYPSNFTEFHLKYNGLINTSNIYSRFYEIINVDIPKLYLDINNFKSDTDIVNYFNNQKYINNSLGIDNINDFKKMIKILNNFNKTNLEYLNCQVIKSSSKKYSDRTEFKLKIVYKEEKNIILKIIIYNYKKNEDFMKIIPIVEE
ncbi:MAG: hypothetical protein E7313_02360 [Clostridiales bacterium]|nr:hypothetical protein [Clostridiales bacterium]